MYSFELCHHKGVTLFVVERSDPDNTYYVGSFIKSFIISYLSLVTRAFVWTLGGTEDTFDRQVGGLPGISVTFTVKATSNIFIHISEIRIIVHPYT